MNKARKILGIILFSIVTLFVVLIATGCNGDNTADELNIQESLPLAGTATISPSPTRAIESAAPSISSVDRTQVFFEKVRDVGFEVGDEITKIPQIIGAESGKAFYVNGVVVELYEYNPTALTDSGRIFYESAKNNGEIEIFEGYPTSVIFHDDLIMFCDEHPDAEELVKIFMEL